MSIINSKVVSSGTSYAVYSKQPPGVQRGDPHFSMSRGELMNFFSNPRRWLDGFEAKEDSTKATEFGSLLDMLALTPERFDEEYAVAPATYKNEKGEEKAWTFSANICKAWREEQGERTIVKSDVMAEAKTALAALMADKEIAELISVSKRQCFCVAEWKDEATQLSIPIRCLVDLVPDKAHARWSKFLANLKTARCGDPNVFARVCDDNFYDVSAALELDIFTAATGDDRCEAVFPVIENVPPYHVTKPLISLTVEFVSYGRAKYESALRLYAQCLATGNWPSYSTGGRLVFGPCQYIGPESLYRYRESGGVV